MKAQFNRQFKELNEDMLQGKHRYYIVKGSAGSGKSVNVAQILIMMLSMEQNKGMNLLVVRKTKESHHGSTMQELVKAIRRLGLESQWKLPSNLTNGVLSLVHISTGNEIRFAGVNSTEDIESLKSITFANGALVAVWIEEATEIRFEDFMIIDDRLRGDLSMVNPNLHYMLVLTFNPVSPQHWIKKKYWDIPDKMVYLSHSTYLGNRFCDEEFHRRMMKRKEIDPEGYVVYGLGDWGELGGLILPNVKVISEEDFRYDDEYYEELRYGADWGFNHASAILDIGFRDGDVYIRDEIYVREKVTSEIIEIAEKKHLDKFRKMNCDSAEPDRIKEWQDAGYNSTPVKKRGAKVGTQTGQSELNYVKAQIDWLRQRTIYISSRCENTIDEIMQWKWLKDKTTGEYTDKPTPIHDDAMAALRYGTDDWRNGDSVYFLT